MKPIGSKIRNQKNLAFIHINAFSGITNLNDIKNAFI